MCPPPLACLRRVTGVVTPRKNLRGASLLVPPTSCLFATSHRSGLCREKFCEKRAWCPPPACDEPIERSDFTYAVAVTSCEGKLTKNEWPQFLVDVRTGFVSGTFLQGSAANGEERTCTLQFTATAAGGSQRPIETVKVTAVKSAKAKAEEAIEKISAGVSAAVFLALPTVKMHGAASTRETHVGFVRGGTPA